MPVVFRLPKPILSQLYIFHSSHLNLLSFVLFLSFTQPSPSSSVSPTLASSFLKITSSMPDSSVPAAAAMQRIHPSMLAQLDPQYIRFHLEHVLHLVPPHTLPWDPAIRNAPAVPGGSDPIPVGEVKDFDFAKTRVRAYIPEGSVPEGGWPVLLYFHGGAFSTLNRYRLTTWLMYRDMGTSRFIRWMDSWGYQQ